MLLKEDWEFNVLGIYNYKRPGPLENYFNFIIENHDRVEGDLLEAGVFQGRSLLGVSLLLKELGSNKKIYGFDTFKGFPQIYHENDDLKKFDEFHRDGRITSEHLEKVKRNVQFRSLLINDPSARNLSLSGDFSASNMDLISKKIDLLGLDNVHLVAGSFDETLVPGREQPGKIMTALFDCDLYSSYMSVLPFVWDRLSKGGYIYLDEYYSLKFPGARIATDEFFRDRSDKPFRHKQKTGDFERWAVQKLYG